MRSPRRRPRLGAQAQTGIQIGGVDATAKKLRSNEGFATLDAFLDEQGTREKLQAVAIKEVSAWLIERTMKEQ